MNLKNLRSLLHAVAGLSLLLGLWEGIVRLGPLFFG
jgi:hypothetical protein